MTTASTKPRIVDKLRAVARENLELFNDIQTLKEMITFTFNDNGSAAAQQGAHDDTVMALAIGHEARPQQVTYTDKPVPKEKDNIHWSVKVDSTDDPILKEYYRAQAKKKLY